MHNDDNNQLYFYYRPLKTKCTLKILSTYIIVNLRMNLIKIKDSYTKHS